MTGRDVPLFHALLRKRDFYAGGLMTLLGGAVTLDSATYDLGTLTRMGPGMFPFMLGFVLVFIGILILGTAVATPLSGDERILPAQKQWRGWGCILAGPILFIIFGQFFGLFPATFMCVFVSALGERTATFKGSFILAFGVALFGSLLFVYLLQSPFPMFKWDV
ncbi:MAG: tripartite tricarboxylate transporter TctB family protein [Bradyrhizobium sp.]